MSARLFSSLQKPTFPNSSSTRMAEKELKRTSMKCHHSNSYLFIYSSISLGEPDLNKSSIGCTELTFFCGGISLTCEGIH